MANGRLFIYKLKAIVEFYSMTVKHNYDSKNFTSDKFLRCNVVIFVIISLFMY